MHTTQRHPKADNITSMKMFDLSGKNAIITGGNGGIGLAMARALAEAGCTISIWGRNPEKTAAAAHSIGTNDAPVHHQSCDLTDFAATTQAFNQTVAKLGRIDGCFINAGIGGGGRGSFLKRGFAEWQDMFKINVDSAFHLFQLTARHMVDNPRNGSTGGRLVATSSIGTLFGVGRNEHYGASKLALNGLVRALAVELGRYGITANAILPGYSETEMTKDLFANEQFSQAVIPRIPLRRYGKPEDFGGIAVYLQSDASAYHTADCIVIDGGYSAY
jgi:NAD(P)-dependent dehydrogenase (short-subunit alcohol dehydrogenase family)